MSHIKKLSIKHYRGIDILTQDFGSEKFIILIGRGDSGKSTILSAINSVLSPSWNMSFSDLDFYNQDISKPIEIEIEVSDLPHELITDRKYGLYVTNDLSEEDCEPEKLSIIISLTVDDTLEPHWTVKARENSDMEDKQISAQDRALIAVSFITDYTDNQFAYNKLSPLYALTRDTIGNSKTIDSIKSKMLRTMSNSLNDDDLAELKSPLNQLKSTAESIGLTINDLTTNVDIKENPYTGNSIALHEVTDSVSLPFRLHGKGSKRLMSVAIQMELAQKGGIALIDEIEQGLEPDRIATLVRLFKNISKGQIFITTHSMNVVLEAKANNLFVLNKGAAALSHVDSDMDDCRRSNPQAFFGRKLIVCEGKTEYGFLRELDLKLDALYKANFATKGIVIVNAGGGNKIYTYALKLKNLGYEVCVFADNDVTKQLHKSIDAVDKAGIPSFLCEKGFCFEKEIIQSISWGAFVSLAKCDQINELFNLSENIIAGIDGANTEQEQNRLREEIQQIAITKKWFKNIPGGEFIAKFVFDDYSNISRENNLRKNIDNLIKWCGFGDNGLDIIH